MASQPPDHRKIVPTGGLNSNCNLLQIKFTQYIHKENTAPQGRATGSDRQNHHEAGTGTVPPLRITASFLLLPPTPPSGRRKIKATKTKGKTARFTHGDSSEELADKGTTRGGH